ncbi:MAPEG family protein [Blastomonas fulva]|uniref:MAPEG family protein n=1 Tax=Blastomonas fulva TaxID=1550728 RepID=UPI0025A34132|nr:MAPEG family protein [Blastomonas fulva]MDM7929573.1 MAPEG family protein [Blastomonas fulva]MDM7967380.1 MAPEG family protein [Blastomonas fulva]
MTSAILQPVVILLAWTMVMWLWMYVTRIPAMQRAKIDVANLKGGTGKDLDAVLPPEVQWKAHNYNHLLAEPTVFYAVCIVLAISGHGEGLNLAVAWLYVALRVAHSLLQATVNRVAIRFLLFASSSLCLIVLVFHAAIPIFDLHLHG